jgi:hypothetical protein
MQKPYKSLRVFKNPILERFTHVHPLTPLILWAPIAGWLIWRSFAVHQMSLASVALLGACGFFLWTLVEYLLHRYFFHLEGESPFIQRMHFLIHGLHHDDPQDPTRLVMPPVASILIAIVLYNCFRGILGEMWV